VTCILGRMFRAIAATYVLLLALTGSWSPAAADYHGDSVSLLVVHSYSQDYLWTAGQHEGFVAALEQSIKSPLTVKTEYLDTKRKMLDSSYAEEFIRFLNAKYENFSPQAIYVTDDNGLNFAVERLTAIFPDVPIFFSGVNDLTQLDRLDFSKVTGVFEKKEIGPNLELLKHLLGEMGQIVVVGDASPTYRAIENELKKELETNLGLKVQYVADNRIDVVLDAIRQKNKPRILLTTLGAMRNSAGQVLTLAETISEIVRQQPEVVISMEDVYLLDGVLGGFVTSSTAQGRAAAALLHDYLSGTPVSELKPVVKSPNEYILNDRVLEKIGIDLPPEIAAMARLINPRIGLFEKYREFVVIAVGLLSAALAATLLMYALTMRIKSNQLMRSSNLITEQGRKLEESEGKYRTLFEMSEDPMWVIIGDKFMIANDAAAHELGYAGVDELVNLHPSELSPPQQSDGKTSFDKANEMMSIAYNRGFHRFEWDHVRKSGEVFPVEVSLTQIPFDQGEALFCIWRNITSQKNAERQMVLARAVAEQASQAKSEFLATMSHELRTPLNAIIGFSEMIEGQYFGKLGSQKYGEYANDIHTSSQHLLQLVNDILDLSAIEAGEHQLSRENIMISEVAEDCSRFISDTADSRGIQFDIAVPESLPPLHADKRAVKQILLNLLSNALKFTPEGGQIVLKVTAPNGNHIIEVSDTGVGVPEDKLANLTDPFVMAQTDPHKQQQGTGLGLAIVKTLVDLHGGELDIKSEVGKGMTVVISLPSGVA